MTQEEKAKAYDKALEKARQLCAYPTSKPFISDLQDLFPELMESEDERMKKIISDILLIDSDDIREILESNNVLMQDIDAWLEKQGEHANFRNKIQIGDKVTRNEDGVLVNLSQLNRVAKKDEQKPADKVEPKFKVGDWVILTAGELSTMLQIVKVDTDKKLYWFNDSSYLPIVDEECLHLWTIQDAKDGDVLACPNDAGDRDVVFIFKNINNDEGWVFCFCASDANGCFCTNNDYVGNSNSTNISPATKEQRNLLFQKMKEAGYEWDAEQKQLKKIEDKPAWSEEDEEIKKKVMHSLSLDGRISNTELTDIYNWFKYLKDRVQPQPRQEYSKEVSSDISIVIEDLRTLLSNAEQSPDWVFNLRRDIDILNSLKHQYRWKPSDEQIRELGIVATGKGWFNKEILSKLLEQLKNLKEGKL